MKVFDKIKYYYGKGLYNNFHLDGLLFVGVISAVEYDELLKGEHNG